MASYDVTLPDEIIRDFENIYKNTNKIFGEMTQAGADVVYKNIKANAPQGMKKSKIMRCLKQTKAYKTPSDGGINIKVGFYGYFTNGDGKTVPAPLVANVFEYGRSNAPFSKQPFMRRSFNKRQIEQAMEKKQKEASGGLLE